MSFTDGFIKMIREKNLGIYYKTLEINLKTNTKDYQLDKFQSLNGKMLVKIIIPSTNAAFYPANLFGGDGTYATNPQSKSGKPLANIEAIDGAYLTLTNTRNQQVLDTVPLMLYRQDPDYFSEKGAFKDLPTMDWTQSLVEYPTTDIPDAEEGNSWQMVICYLDTVEEGK